MLLDKGLVELPDPRVPEEIGKVSDPKYCDFHRMVQHGTEKCYTLKKIIQRLLIWISSENSASTNATSLPSRTDTSNTMMLPPEQYASQQNERLQNVERRRKGRMKWHASADGGCHLSIRDFILFSKVEKQYLKESLWSHPKFKLSRGQTCWFHWKQRLMAIMRGII